MTSPDSLALAPAPVRAAHARWLDRPESAALDELLLALVAHHRPARAKPLAPGEPRDASRLVADLGYDSLTLAELALAVEDLLGVMLCSADLRSVLSVADLRAQIARKLPARAA